MKKSDIDMEVAIQVMGLGRFAIRKVPKYSSDIAEAMTVFSEMQRRGHRWVIVGAPEGFFLRRVAYNVEDGIKHEMVYHCDRPLDKGPAKTPEALALVICVAALQERKSERKGRS